MLLVPSLGHVSAPQVIYLFLAVTFAAFFRGYSGFGFSLAAVPTLSVVLEPADAVPVSLLLEIALTLRFAPEIWPSIQWQPVRRLLLGALLGTPFGVYALSAVPPGIMRFVLGGILLGSVLTLWRRPGLVWNPGRAATLGIGTLSGLLSGGTAMSGPPVVLLFLGLPVTSAMRRASMMAYFLMSALLAEILDVVAGLSSMRTVLLAVLMCPPLLLGSALGARCFAGTEPATYRLVSLLMLTSIGAFAIAYSVIAVIRS